MGMETNVVSVDPSFRNWGMIRGVLSPCGGFEVLSAVLHNEAPPVHKSKSMSDLLRSEYISNCYREYVSAADVVFVELPTGSKSARAAKLSGICTGILSQYRTGLDGPRVFYVTPAAVKKITGLATPDKKDMMDWAYARHPGQFWVPYANGEILNKNGKLLGANEHIADAIAITYAGLVLKEFKTWLKDQN